jgi:hypothetical protein
MTRATANQLVRSEMSAFAGRWRGIPKLIDRSSQVQDTLLESVHCDPQHEDSTMGRRFTEHLVKSLHLVASYLDAIADVLFQRHERHPNTMIASARNAKKEAPPG